MCKYILSNIINSEAWSFRLCPGGSGSAATSIVAVRSLIWPGATAVAAAKKYNNVYVGYGIQYEAKAYTPPMPPLLYFMYLYFDLI